MDTCVAVAFQGSYLGMFLKKDQTISISNFIYMGVDPPISIVNNYPLNFYIEQLRLLRLG